MKVRCTYSFSGLFTKGKIYEIENKQIVSDKDEKIKFESVETYNNRGVSQFELVQDFTLSDIKERWLVVFANGKEGVFNGEEFKIIENGKYTRDSRNIEYYNEDLTHKNNKAWSITKVLKSHYSEVWERPIEKQAKKMTVSEIASVLGYDVEIVKE